MEKEIPRTADASQGMGWVKHVSQGSHRGQPEDAEGGATTPNVHHLIVPHSSLAYSVVLLAAISTLATMGGFYVQLPASSNTISKCGFLLSLGLHSSPKGGTIDLSSIKTILLLFERKPKEEGVKSIVEKFSEQ